MLLAAVVAGLMYSWNGAGVRGAGAPHRGRPRTPAQPHHNSDQVASNMPPGTAAAFDSNNPDSAFSSLSAGFEPAAAAPAVAATAAESAGFGDVAAAPRAAAPVADSSDPPPRTSSGPSTPISHNVSATPTFSDVGFGHCAEQRWHTSQTASSRPRPPVTAADKASRALVIFKLARTGSTELAMLLREAGGFCAFLPEVSNRCPCGPEAKGCGAVNVSDISWRLRDSRGAACTAVIELALRVLACGGGFTLNPFKNQMYAHGKPGQQPESCFERFVNTAVSRLPDRPVVASLTRDNAVAMAASHLLSKSLTPKCGIDAYHADRCPQLLTAKISPTPKEFFNKVAEKVRLNKELVQTTRWVWRQWARRPGNGQAVAAQAGPIEMTYEQLAHSGANGSFGIPQILVQAVFDDPAAATPNAARNHDLTDHPPVTTEAPAGRLRSKLANYDELMEWAINHAPEHVDDLAR